MKRVLVGVMFASSFAFADPIAWSPPGTCPDGFTCGALSARLAAHDNDWPGAFVAVKRACSFDALFCRDYARLLVDAGPSRGGDAQKGLMMLEGMCKKDPDVCSSLARIYDSPPPASGLTRDSAKAERLLTADCARGDSLGCSALARLYLKGGPGVAIDQARARIVYDRGCASTDVYGPGVCGALADDLVRGTFNGAPDVKAAMPYLEKSCPQGYRCDLAIDILLNGKGGVAPDLEKAKKLARTSCERSDCELIDVVGKRDPAWATRELADLCAKGHKGACKTGANVRR